MRIDDCSVSSDTCLHAHDAIQSLDDFTNCHGPTFSKVGPNNSVQLLKFHFCGHKPLLNVHVKVFEQKSTTLTRSCLCWHIWLHSLVIIESSSPISNPQFFTFQNSWVSILKRKKIPRWVKFQTEFGPTNIHSPKLNDLLYQLHTCLMPYPHPTQPWNVLFEKLYT
jgi:hypothetical protein